MLTELICALDSEGATKAAFCLLYYREPQGKCRATSLLNGEYCSTRQRLGEIFGPSKVPKS